MNITYTEGAIFQYDLLHVESGVDHGTISLETFDFHRYPCCKRHRHFRQTRISEGLDDAY